VIPICSAGGADAGPNDAGTTGKAGPVDILFVVDNSAGMDTKQVALRNSLPAFIAMLSGIDVQIGVVTTDLDSMDASGHAWERTGTTNLTHAASAPYYLQSIDAQGCNSTPIEHGCFRGDDPASRIWKLAAMGPGGLTRLQGNSDVGSCGSGIERGLGAIRAALTQVGPGGCNSGFLRSGARLVIAILSDEDDTDTTAVPSYVDYLGTVKSFDQIRVATITASENGTATNCSIPNAANCGHSVCDNPPPQGSHKSCTTDADCATMNEYCVPGQNQCQNRALQNWDPMYCGWCLLFSAPDCCTALLRNNPLVGEGGRYVKFAQLMEAKIAAADPKIAVSSCRPAPGARAACLVESICQADYTDTLSRIAIQLIEQ
jgi:hypothetical protein